MTAKNRNSEEVARVERSSWNAYGDYVRSVECQVDGERWEKEDENAHIGAGTGTGDNSSADDIKIDPNKTSLASGEFGNKDYN